jgi:hypothetical protein
VIPVVDDKNDATRRFHREVRVREDVLNKLGISGEHLLNKTVTEAPVDEFKVEDHNADSVVNFAQAHPDQLEKVIKAEKDGKNRSTLLTRLDKLKQDKKDEKAAQKILDASAPEEDETSEEINEKLAAQAREIADKQNQDSIDGEDLAGDAETVEEAQLENQLTDHKITASVPVDEAGDAVPNDVDFDAKADLTGDVHEDKKPAAKKVAAKKTEKSDGSAKG